MVIKNNALGKLFVDFSEVSPKEKMYIVISALFYLFSIYQNVLVCIRFNYNMIKIHTYINEVRSYADRCLNNMNNYLQYSSTYVSQTNFNDCLRQHIGVLTEMKLKLDTISDYKLTIWVQWICGLHRRYHSER